MKQSLLILENSSTYPDLQNIKDKLHLDSTTVAISVTNVRNVDHLVLVGLLNSCTHLYLNSRFQQLDLLEVMLQFSSRSLQDKIILIENYFSLVKEWIQLPEDCFDNKESFIYNLKLIENNNSIRS